MRIRDWSSDVCSSDLSHGPIHKQVLIAHRRRDIGTNGATLPTVVAADGEGGDVGKLELDPRARREAAGVKDILAVEDVDAKTFALIAIAHGDVHRGAVGQTASNVSRCIDGVVIAVSGLDARRKILARRRGPNLDDATGRITTDQEIGRANV